ncbi:DUF4421 domain-containing protein [Treponema primitia]|uniref:DUF4421 family protein n=1 Tax=Treponema primitia TaxID=88058 RepID=UPI00397F4809
MNKISYKSIVLLFCVLNSSLSFAEDAIVPFDEKIALNISGKYNMGIFQQQSTSYRTNKPWDVGLGIRYKNLAAQLFIPTSLNDNSFDAAVNFYFEKMYYETYIKRYRNFYLKEDDESMGYENAGLDMMSGGIMAGRIHNYKNHSLRSVFTMSEKQTTPSGSFLYGFGVFYTSVYSQNETMSRYNGRQHIAYFGPTAGYSHTWTLPHSMFLNVGINMGANFGININDTKMLFIPQINPKITFGHHNNSWSINAVMGCNTSVLLWSKDNLDILIPATMGVTFSNRF